LSGLDAEEDVKCRICLGGPDEGRMFSPCLCRGSIQLVHVACLNQWRRSSANPRSYYQCEQCQYQYQLRRAWFATILLDKAFVSFLSVLVLLVIMGMTSVLVCPLLWYLEIDLALKMYRWCAWYPWWLDQRGFPTLAQYRAYFDFVISGWLILGSIGFVHWAYHQYVIHRQRADGWYRLLWLAACFGGTQTNFRTMRLAMGLGSFFTLYHLYGITKIRCAAIAQTWGESILEVREGNG